MFDRIDVLPLGGDDPRRIDRYGIEGRLGVGGQGVVYLGRAPDGRPVAVKVLSGGLPTREVRARFVRELAAARRVPQAHTAAILDADVEGERPYIVSEYVAGPSLQEAVEKNGVFAGNALERLATYTITALAAIHGARVVHRDFKPSNVLIGPDGPRVVDFGIARALDSGEQTTNSLIGTPPYMAPEQFGGQPAGPHTDVFAWAATMVFAATGNPPFGRMSFAAVANRILNESPDLADLASPLRDVLARCLAKDPADRPTSIQVLQALVGHDTFAGPYPSPVAGRGESAAVPWRPAGGVLPGVEGGETGPTGTGAPWFRRGSVIAALTAATAVAVAVSVVTVINLRDGGEAGAARRPVETPRPAETTAVSGLPAGLAGFWDFGERAGSSAADSTGGEGLLLSRGANWEAHPPPAAKGALYLDGVKGYAATDDRPVVDSTESFTATARVRIDRSPSDFYYAAAASQEATDGYYSFAVQYMSCTARAEPDSTCPGRGEHWSLSVYGESGQVERLVSSTKVKPLTWVHLAAVHDREAGAAGEVRLYVDGRLEDAKPLKEPIRPSSGPFYVGRSTYGEPVDFWPGAVTNVALWDRALSEADVRSVAVRN
ncbi:protein kinase [Streptosporangium sp. NPDC002721]|uniref:protein kinase domain-containing protein n=1 Tax=Streptosporangium sp. NPDC002721 TaxID=3366188 RepID=UPI0036CFD6BB